MEKLENKFGVIKTTEDTCGCNRAIILELGGVRCYSFINSRCGERVGRDIYYCKYCADDEETSIEKQNG